MPRPAFVRERILGAAFDLIARRSYEAVSTRDIAKEAAVGAASMFKHFPSKEALGRELYTQALAPLLAQLQQLAGKTPHEVVDGLVKLLCEAYDRRPRALALLVFPPHDFTPWELDHANSLSFRRQLQAMTGLDEDGEAVLWGAVSGPLCDRFLRRRGGLMTPLIPELQRRCRSLIL